MAAAGGAAVVMGSMLEVQHRTPAHAAAANASQWTPEVQSLN